MYTYLCTVKMNFAGAHETRKRIQVGTQPKNLNEKPKMLDDTTTPSKTALMVALFLIILGSDDYGSSKCPPGAVAAQITVLNGVVPFPMLIRLIHNPLFGKLARWVLHTFVHEQFLEGIGVRKTYMEHGVRTFLSKRKNTNRAQVLVLASGYDTLATRLCQDYKEDTDSASTVTFWEVDHPATYAATSSSSKRKQNQSGHCVQSIMADLTTTKLKTALSLPSSLEKNDPYYDPTIPTVVIIEGLTMYLTGTQLLDLLSDVSTVIGKGSRICFDHFGWKNGTFENGWLTQCQMRFAKLLGEEWHWGIDPKDLQEFLKDSQYKIIDQSTKVGMEFMVTLELL